MYNLADLANLVQNPESDIRDALAKPVDRARKALAFYAGRGDQYGGDLLLGLAQDVVNAEAVAGVAYRYVYFLDALAEKDLSESERASRIVKWVATQQMGSPDDDWSGRKNDSRRSANDAVRAFLSSIFESVAF